MIVGERGHDEEESRPQYAGCPEEHAPGHMVVVFQLFFLPVELRGD
jgi:hypothetical protein